MQATDAIPHSKIW